MSRRKQAKPRSLKVEDNASEDQRSTPGPVATPSDPEAELGIPAEDGEEADLKRKLVSVEEEEEGEEDAEALHSCGGCRQVFESLSDLTEHKINQCQLTDGSGSSLREKPAGGPGRRRCRSAFAATASVTAALRMTGAVLPPYLQAWP